MKNGASSRELLSRFKHFLEGMKLNIDHPAFAKAIEFLTRLPIDITPYEVNDLRRVVCSAFSLSDEELSQTLAKEEGLPVPKKEDDGSLFGTYDMLKAEDDLLKLIPSKGFIPDYLEYVKRTEPPIAFHVFSALVGCGAMLGGKVWVSMGVYDLYPPLAVLLLGPSGVKKTTSSNVIVDLIQRTESIKIYTEMATPQALAEDMMDMPQGLIYAPELTSTLITRDKFMEGMVTFLTRLLDHPRPSIKKRTVKGGVIVLDEPTPSLLACSTLDWLVEKTPEGTFGGGFMARNILVMQEDSPRCEPRPFVLNPNSKLDLVKQLSILQNYAGRIDFAPNAEKAYHEWYREQKPKWRNPEVELMSTIYHRRADNVQRLACILHLSHCDTSDICLSCFEKAAGLLEWTDQFTVPALKKVFKSGTGKDQEIVLRSIASMGGVVEHSALVRRLQYRMNAQQLKVVVASLIDAKQVEERKSKLQHTYFLRG
jgi:hypothetical protein